MKVSVCMATYNRDPKVLNQVLNSIIYQEPTFPFEVIVVDDGSEGNSTKDLCQKLPVIYYRVDRSPVRRNPCVARNIACKLAKGELLVLQSDDVVHKTVDSLAKLVAEVTKCQNSFVIANVFGCDASTRPRIEYTGQERQVPYFFLGVVWRKHFYAVGGNDEDFEDFLGYEDDWFGDCLINGLHLTPVYLTSVVGHHLHHLSSATEPESLKAKEMYSKKYKKAERTGIWVSSGGSWENTLGV